MNRQAPCAWKSTHPNHENGCARLKDGVSCHPDTCEWYETAEQRAARERKAAEHDEE